MRYPRVRIHSTDDPQYRAYIANIMASKSNQRALRPPSNRSLFGGEAEVLLRQWLTQWYTLSERRFVEYDERMGNQLIRKYRELDAMVERSATHLHVFEMKATSQIRSVTRGIRQLRETQHILKTICPRIECTLLLVDTGIINADEVAELMAGVDAPNTQPLTLPEYVAANPELRMWTAAEYPAQPAPQTIDVVVFQLADIRQLAGDSVATLHLDWSDELEEYEEPEPVIERYTSTSDESESDDNPLAAALQRALKERGGGA